MCSPSSELADCSLSAALASVLLYSVTSKVSDTSGTASPEDAEASAPSACVVADDPAVKTVSHVRQTLAIATINSCTHAQTQSDDLESNTVQRYLATRWHKEDAMQRV